jgi:hypothetical protein
MHRFPIIRYISIVDYFFAFKYQGRVFSAVSHRIVSSDCVVSSHCKNVNVLMYVQLGNENSLKCQNPGTNASIERLFSITNALWTDEKKFPR